MALVHDEVTDERDFDEILPVLFAAFGEPYNSLRYWFIPVHTTERAAVEAAKDRLVKKWKEHDDLHWIKVTDTETGRIIGAAEWEIRRTLPPPEARPEGPLPPKGTLNAYWHKEGEEKAFAEMLLTQLGDFMKQNVTRPHIELEQLFVHPDHRRKGVARLLTKWGVDKADELGLETWVESMPFPVPIYEKLGFGNVATMTMDFTVPNPTEGWKKLADDDYRIFLMWRPAGHDFQPGIDDGSGPNFRKGL